MNRLGGVDTVIVVGRRANVQATHTVYDWIAGQLERFVDAPAVFVCLPANQPCGPPAIL